MAGDIVSTHRAEIDVVWTVDKQGISIALQAPLVMQLLARGITSITLHDVPLRPEQPVTPWLTVTDAARILLRDMRPACDDSDTERLLSTAKSRISRACDRGKIEHAGHGSERRIEPRSFDAWCLASRRAADLD